MRGLTIRQLSLGNKTVAATTSEVRKARSAGQGRIFCGEQARGLHEELSEKKGKGISKCSASLHPSCDTRSSFFLSGRSSASIRLQDNRKEAMESKGMLAQS